MQNLTQPAQPLSDVEILFLKESNAIEGVLDDDSLEQAKLAWQYLKGQKEISSGVVLETHKILMQNQALRHNEKGYFRSVPVYIGDREAVEWIFIPEKIKDWADKMNKPNWTDIGPVGLHIIYEKIHPFVDGNGRTGRMFMNWQMLKMGRPLLIIKNSEKQKYYNWFN